MKTKRLNLKVLLYVLVIALTGASIMQACKKKDNEEIEPASNTDPVTPAPTAKAYELIIVNGAVTMIPDETITYTAVLVNSSGIPTVPTSVSWSSSNTAVCSISAGGVVTTAGTGDVIISASVTTGGHTYTASVPLGVFAPGIFAVSPSAIIWEAEGTLQLEAIYFSPTSTVPTYTYSSDNTSVATVSSSGLVSFVAVGECVITVTATNLDGSPEIMVPVLVVGLPGITLPITQIVVSPASKDLFKTETQTLTAEAYDMNNQVVSAAFTWSSLNSNIATVDASTGLVTPLKTGKTYIKAEAQGISGQAEIIVNPDTLVVVDPFYVSVPQGGTQQFTAAAYELTRTSTTLYSSVTTFDWMVPTYGVPVFDIATVDGNGLVTLKSNAMMGMMTFVVASVPGKPTINGGSMVVVGMASSCNCGSGNPSVASITVANGTSLTMSMFAGYPLQLNVTANDSGGGPVASPALVYCSDNEMVAMVDEFGEITAMGLGTATITVCSGTYASVDVALEVTM